MTTDRHNTPTSLGEHIRQSRQAKGLSGVQLARAARTNPSNISRIERGETLSPTPDLLKRIADALGLDVGELLGYLGLAITPSSPPLHTYLRQTYPELPEQALREAEAAVNRIAEDYEADRR